MSILLHNKAILPDRKDALPGRQQEMSVPEKHYINAHTLQAPFPDNMQQTLLGLGCFWGAEKVFWQLEGVYTTAVGYAAGSRLIRLIRKSVLV